MRDWVDVFGLESFFCARDYLFLCKYLGTLLCAPWFLVFPLSRLMCEMIVSYVVYLPSGRASWFMY